MRENPPTTLKYNKRPIMKNKEVLKCFRKYGCLVANTNRLAKEIYNVTASKRPSSLLGSSDTQGPGALPPSSKPSTVDILKWLSGEHERNREFVKTFVFAPFKRIPDVRAMTIKLSEIDHVFKSHQVDKRRLPGELVITPYKNAQFNRYAAVMISRLRRQKDGDLY